MTKEQLIQAIVNELNLKNPYPAQVDQYGICAGCGTWAPHKHPEAGEHKENCPAIQKEMEYHNLRQRIFKVLNRSKIDDAEALTLERTLLF